MIKPGDVDIDNLTFVNPEAVPSHGSDRHHGWLTDEDKERIRRLIAGHKAAGAWRGGR